MVSSKSWQNRLALGVLKWSDDGRNKYTINRDSVPSSVQYRQLFLTIGCMDQGGWLCIKNIPPLSIHNTSLCFQAALGKVFRSLSITSLRIHDVQDSELWAQSCPYVDPENHVKTRGTGTREKTSFLTWSNLPATIHILHPHRPIKPDLHREIKRAIWSKMKTIHISIHDSLTITSFSAVVFPEEESSNILHIVKDHNQWSRQ